MTKSGAKRGRPRKANPMGPAERRRNYRKRKRYAGLKSVSRWMPDEGEDIRRYSDHRLLDARSLALHCTTGQKISRDPRIRDVARQNLARCSERSSGDRPQYIQEWRQNLARPWSEIAFFITSTSDRAMQLRQSSPFAGVLDTEERKRIYEAFEA